MKGIMRFIAGLFGWANSTRFTVPSPERSLETQTKERHDLVSEMQANQSELDYYEGRIRGLNLKVENVRRGRDDFPDGGP